MGSARTCGARGVNEVERYESAHTFFRAEHVKKNLYSLVPEGLGAALDALRGRGVKVVIVSNSEGMLEPLFEQLDIRSHFDLIADSDRLGFEKPDPRIFECARCVRCAPRGGAAPGRFERHGRHRRAEGRVRVMLVDPYGHCAGRALDVPRVSGVVEVAQEILRSHLARA